MLLLAQAGTLAGFLLLAFANSLEMMFLSRIIDGLFGGTYPIAKAVVGDGVPPSKRSEQMSNIGVAHVLSSLIGLGLFVPTYLLLGTVTNQLQFALVLVFVSFSAACSRGILNSFLSCMVKPWEQGAAMGLSASFDSFAQIAGPLIGGIVLGSMPIWVYGSIAALFSLGAFAMSWRPLRLGDEMEAAAASG